MSDNLALGNFRFSYGPDAGETPFTTRPEIVGSFGVVASTHWLGTAAGMRILEKGGNAFDAAVAIGFALQVVEPHLVGFGGEVPIIFHDARSKQARVLCGQGTAPANATIEHFAGLGLDVVPGSGFLPACVPGSFGAWMTLLRDYGTMGVEDVLELGDRLCPRRLRHVAENCGCDRNRRALVSDGMADLGRNLSEGRRAQGRNDVQQPRSCRHL